MSGMEKSSEVENLFWSKPQILHEWSEALNKLAVFWMGNGSKP